MAGNVREWCYNQDGGNRFILGGGWNDLPYQFTDTYTQPMFDRSPDQRDSPGEVSRERLGPGASPWSRSAGRAAIS